MKRKSIALLLALMMCLALLSACGGDNTPEIPEPPSSESTAQPPAENEKPEESEEPKEEEPEESTEPEPAVPAEMTYTFDVATGTLTCSGGGEVTLNWVDAVKNALFETDVNKCRDAVKTSFLKGA